MSYNIPHGYKELEYLESTGTQYIETGFVLNTAGDSIEIECAPVEITGTNSQNYQGVCGLNGGPQICWGLDGSTPIFTIGNAGSSTPWSPILNLKDTISWDYTSGNMRVNGLKTNLVRTGNMTCKLFQCEDGCKKARIFHVIIYKSNKKVMELVPVLDETNTACFYDLVSKSKFTNAGSGTFLYTEKQVIREVLPSGYTRCEFIETTGTQYLNLGFGGELLWELDLEFMSQSTRQYIGFAGTGDEYFGVNPGSSYSSTGYFEKIGNTAGEMWYNRLNMRYDVGIRNSKHTTAWILGSDTAYSGTPSSNGYDNLYTRPVYIGGLRDSATSSVGFLNSLRIFEIKATNKNNKIVCWYIPALDSNNAPGLYNMVTDTFIKNIGSGTLVYRKDPRGLVPGGYTVCEYIEGDGFQYLNTGIDVYNYSKYPYYSIETKVSFNKTGYNTNYIWGTTDDASGTYGCWLDDGTETSVSGGGITTKVNNSVARDYARVIKDRIYYIRNYSNSVQHYAGLGGYAMSISAVSSSVTWGGKLCLFGTPTEASRGDYKLYYVIIKNNDVVVFNGVPCLDQNSRPCLWDTVSSTTFYSIGDGDFRYLENRKSAESIKIQLQRLSVRLGKVLGELSRSQAGHPLIATATNDGSSALGGYS